MTGVRFRVTGRVQGVGFRAHARAEALRLGIDGEARNLDDGSVELHAHGSASAVEEFAKWLANGPPHARVTSVAREATDDATPRRGFSIG